MPRSRNTAEAPPAPAVSAAKAGAVSCTSRQMLRNRDSNFFIQFTSCVILAEGAGAPGGKTDYRPFYNKTRFIGKVVTKKWKKRGGAESFFRAA